MNTENKPKKTYWKGVEQLSNRTDFVKHNANEFSEKLPINDAFGEQEEEGHNRRDFLKLMGFSLAAVSMAACEAPVRKAIPYLNKPEDINPGIPNYYASTFNMGGETWPVVVKTREGRPIFVEGNKLSKMTEGGVNSRVQSSVMSLYDIEKVKNPTKSGKKVDWSTVDKEIIAQLSKIAERGGEIAIVSNSITSPSTKKVINDFQEKYPTANLYMYDTESASSIREANKEQFGTAMVPSLKFDKADVIVGVGADFLGNWISDIEYAKDYSKGRKLGKSKKKMSQHFQFEPIMTMTGANADYRATYQPSQEGLVVAALYNEVANATGGSSISAAKVDLPLVKKAAKALINARGKSLVVSGSSDVNVQLLVNAINQQLENYGQTIDTSTPTYQKQGDDKAFTSFVGDLSSRKVEAVIFYGCNPVYDSVHGSKIASAVSKAKLSIATADRLDETASLCTYNCPDHHFLESWNDAELKKGMFSLGQPTISKIFDTRQVQESLLTWSEAENTSYYDYVRGYWNEIIFPLQSKESSFERFWQQSLHDGVVDVEVVEYNSIHDGESSEASTVDISSLGSALSKYKASSTDIELVLYSSPVMGNGSQANNPILQEIPEPITKVCWGHYVAVSQAKAKELGFTSFETKTSLASISVGSQTIELPVVVQPGMSANTIAIPLGYGRDAEKTGKVSKEAGGVNVFPFATEGLSVTKGVSISNTGNQSTIAQTQTHHTIMGRETIIQESVLSEYQKDPKAGRYSPHISTYTTPEEPGNISLWDIDSKGYKKDEGVKIEGLWSNRMGLKSDQHPYTNHHWGMVVDLNTCIGCSACIVACNIENNVPVVGKMEVARRREMHWLRIDRYYSNPVEVEDKLESGEIGMTDGLLELASDNPDVVFQPMMCQHCNNAPCETVCPVAATTHSSEGLNQMTYNRCVGTKYCANNCPYKVRRFNWFKYHNNTEFDYHMNNDLGKMVLNPDVTVRSRGVMEKCSMCVQRIQAGKLKAKIEGRRPSDADANTACASACPTNAITFGDLNDSDSNIRQLMEEEIDARAYNVLEEIAVKPNIWYLTKIRNKDSEQA